MSQKQKEKRRSNAEWYDLPLRAKFTGGDVPDGYWPALVSMLKSTPPVLDGGDDSEPLV